MDKDPNDATADADINKRASAVAAAPTIVEVIQFLWRGRAWIFVPMVLGLTLATTALFGWLLWSPPETHNRAAIALTGKMGPKGSYRSGLAFSPNDIRNPVVLKRAFEKSGVARYGIKLETLIQAVTVTPYSPGSEAVIARYQKLLSETNLDPARRATIQSDYHAVLREMQTDGAIVTLALDPRYRMPAQDAHVLLDDILTAWSEIYVKEMGGAMPNGSRFGETLVDGDQIESMDFPIAYDYVTSALADAQSRHKEMSKLPGVANLIPADSNFTLGDIERDIHNVKQTIVDFALAPIAEFGLARNPKMTALALQSKIQSLTRNLEEMDSRIKVVDEIIARLDGRGTGVAPGGGGATVTQYSDGLVDRIVELSLKGADNESRHRYLDLKVQLSDQRAVVMSRQNLLLQQRNAIAKGYSGTDLSALEESFRKASQSAVGRLNEVWSKLNQISGMFEVDALNSEKRIYSRIPVPATSLSTWLMENSYVWLVLLGATLIPAIVGLMAYLFRSAVHFRQSNT